MFKVKREFNNDLTKMITAGSITLEEVILDKDLSMTLRNEAVVLLHFLFSDDNYPKLIDYALFDKSAPEKYQGLKSKQINKNAANVLSYASGKIKEQIGKKRENGKPLLLEKLEEFLDRQDLCKSSLFAGHFQKIYENILRDPKSHFNDFFTDEFTQILIPFIVENILILPYKELLEILLEDIILKMDDECVNYILKTILQHASFYSYITFCKQPKTNELIEKYEQSLKYFRSKQPDNENDIPIPFPKITNNLISITKEKKEIAYDKGKKNFPKSYISENPEKIDFSEAKMRTYLYISSIFQSFYNNGRSEFLQNKDFIEMLLYCGVFCDPNSLSCREAFRILENLQYGGFDDEPYESEDFNILIDEYSKYISYKSDYLTEQAISAFPLFWNHRYDDSEEDTEFYINIDPVLNMDTYHICPTKLTPLLKLRPFLLSEPPISDRLNCFYLQIFEKLIKKFKELTQNNDKDMKSYEPEIQEEIRNIHFTIYEFIQREFLFGSEYHNLFDAINLMIPKFPKTQQSAKEPYRPLLNGAAFELFKKIYNENLFIINGKASVLLYDIESAINYPSSVNIFDYINRKPYI